jgi:hypothetical protein
VCSSDLLHLELQNLQTQLQSRPPATKDLSFVALVPKWGGTDNAVPLKEFFDIIESTEPSVTGQMEIWFE